MNDTMQRLAAALAGRYAIERELGAGGMATVYLARDLKHQRRVAVKVLRAELAVTLGAERFSREIEVAAQLQHPHLLPLLDSGTAGGLFYYLMPFVEGESLRQKLTREHQLSIDEALRLTTEIAEAIDYAHQQGIIHRDIKPENILLSRGHALLADFGIALAVREAGGTRLTETGLSLGTPQYMSPEQATGDHMLDARSDVYSLGAVLYEMLTGEPPHSGSTAQAVIAKLMTERPTPVRVLRDTVPEGIDSAVGRALAKVPADRFVSAAAFVEALCAPPRRLMGVVAAPETKAIVVLPFTNVSPDPDNEYFSDGLTDEIITDLSKIDTLRVISRNSAMQLKHTTKDTRTLGRELNVRYVLGGSVRKAGNGIRVTVQLIDAHNDAPLWADKYSGSVEDVFDIQEKLSRTIVEALRIRLTADEERRIAERSFTDVQAYECYQRARQEIWRGSREALQNALRLVQRGLQILGDNELLYAAMGMVYYESVNFMIEAGASPLEKADECVRKVFELNPQSAHGFLLKGALEYKRGNIQQAVRDTKRALVSHPNEPHALFTLSGIYGFSGKDTAARPLADRLLAIDPLSPVSRSFAVWVRLLGGEFQAVLEPLQATYLLAPNEPLSAWCYAMALALNRRDEDACKVVEALPEDVRSTTIGQAMLALRHALRREPSDVRAMLTPELQASLRLDEHFSWVAADCYALIDQRDEALQWLEHAALHRGFINYPLLAHLDPLLAGIRGESRFPGLMTEVKRRWEAFEV